jgi:hypothetical protein
MAVKTNNGITVAIEHIPDDGKNDILQVGTDVWNALVPTPAREGPITVSIGPRHVETGKRGVSLSQSVVCSAVPSKDVQVSEIH